MVFFLLILSLLHVYLGLTALLGAIALFGLTLFTDRATRDPVRTLHMQPLQKSICATYNEAPMRRYSVGDMPTQS